MSAYQKLRLWVLLLTFHKKKTNFCDFSVKNWTERGTVELLKMVICEFFSIRILFSTLIDASLRWPQNRTNQVPPYYLC